MEFVPSSKIDWFTYRNLFRYTPNTMTLSQTPMMTGEEKMGIDIVALVV
jgi:hypothetical protein